MSLVQDEPDSLVLEVAALIKEARRRQVRRRWAVAAVVVLVAAIVTSVAATGWPARTGPKKVVPASPEPGRGSPTGRILGISQLDQLHRPLVSHVAHLSEQQGRVCIRHGRER